MGNAEVILSCSIPDLHEVYQLGTGLGVIPKTSMDSMFTDYLSLGSSAHLSDHYARLQCSLTPDQLTAFNHSLRSTVGESGRVTMGGVGVVALSLALLFDVLAQQVKNRNETSDPIQRIFGEGDGGSISETGTIIGDYLKLVPRIANDPQRMKEETQRYEQRLNITLHRHIEGLESADNLSISEIFTVIHGVTFHHHMKVHLARLGVAIPREQLLRLSWHEQVKDFKLKAENKPLNYIEKLKTLSPENEDLLERCKEYEFYFFSILH